MALCTVSGILVDISNSPIENAIIEARPSNDIEQGTTSLIVQKRIMDVTDSNGAWSLDLVQGTGVVVTMRYTDGGTGEMREQFTITIPATSTANFNDLIS